MPNPFGSNQSSSLPASLSRNGAAGSSSSGPPVPPSADLLVANNVNPSLVVVAGPGADGSIKQLDPDKPQGRISIAIQNQGSATVEIYPNGNKSAFGTGGWQVASGQWIEFYWTEDIKVFAVTGGTSVNLAVFQNIKN